MSEVCWVRAANDRIAGLHLAEPRIAPVEPLYTPDKYDIADMLHTYMLAL